MYSSVSVYKQLCSYLHDGLKNLYQYVFHENWDINSKVITDGGLKYVTYVCNNINSSQKVSQACIISKSRVVSAIIKRKRSRQGFFQGMGSITPLALACPPWEFCSADSESIQVF